MNPKYSSTATVGHLRIALIVGIGVVHTSSCRRRALWIGGVRTAVVHRAASLVLLIHMLLVQVLLQLLLVLQRMDHADGQGLARDGVHHPPHGIQRLDGSGLLCW